MVYRMSGTVLAGYYGCGSIKGNREIFLIRKEKKRKRWDFLAYKNIF